MTVNRYLSLSCSRVYGAIKLCDQIEPCCKASQESVWWSWRHWDCTFSFCSKYWYTNLHSMLEWLMAWPPLPMVLFWGASSLSESPAGVWTRWGKCSPVCFCAQSYRNFPFEEQGFSRLPLSTPKVFGGQGLNPGDEWHEVTHAPNPKHLLWKTDFSSSPSSLKFCIARPFKWNVELPF